MIDKREILDQATATGLNPHVVEKDYVLGWLLWGVANHEATADNWIFKGGTCLKKCFFETYRFSEDLDFTLTDPAHLDEDFLRNVFTDISVAVYDRTGIEIPVDRHRFDLYPNPRGHVSCQARIPYRGPVSPPSLPRVKFDLTADELVVLPPVRLRVFHPYGDEPADGITVSSYTYEEAFAEKTRALGERARPRDLYDVVNLFRHVDTRPKPAVLFDVLRRKCAFKDVEPPAYDRLAQARDILEGSWSQMLGHQLRMLPPFEGFWEELPAFLAWLETGLPPRAPAPFARAPGEEVVRGRVVRLPPSIPFPARAALQGQLDVIRFAATNRLCVDLLYQGSTRRIEPYSLRRTQEGNVILHAHNRDKNAHRSYRLDRIQGARVTDQSFTPRFAVELSPSDPVSVPPTAPRPPSVRTHRRRSDGPTHVYECAYCGKRFYRKTRTRRLNKHKDKTGYPCSGRSAHYIDTRY
ncbi:MAG: nucleotidyl transferase AbiEii/AbiGii toxin family protein [Rhodospirillaceae bacterium]|nr:nucleotidyl transferase AbiEii/AbiGii toxin family protein [Rhodospirillaceae bacterium]